MVHAHLHVPPSSRGRALALAAALAALAPAAVARGQEVAAAPLRIALRPSAEVQRAAVTLGDVADVTGGDAALAARVAALPIGQAPSDGTPVRVRRAALVRWIRARTGLRSADLAWQGPTASTVRLAVVAVPGDVLAAHASAGVRAAAERQGLRAEVQVVDLPRAVAVPAGSLEAKAAAIAPGALRARRVLAPVELRVDGRLIRVVQVALDVTVFGPAYVAAQPVVVGQALAGAPIEVRETEWTGRDLLPVGDHALDGLRLLRPLAVGDVVTRGHLESAPLVRRGEWATVRETQGRVEVESRVEVLEDGRSGQTVRIKPALSTAAILARVTGPDRVEVLP